jgi:hypothetical protein
MRRHVGGIGRGARGRGQTQVTRSGGAELRPGTLGCPARSSLTVEVLREPPPKARTGPRQTPRWSAERRRTFPFEGAHIRNGRADRRSIPPRISGGQGTEGRPTRGRKKTRAMTRGCLNFYPVFTMGEPIVCPSSSLAEMKEKRSHIGLNLPAQSALKMTLLRNLAGVTWLR